MLLAPHYTVFLKYKTCNDTATNLGQSSFSGKKKGIRMQSRTWLYLILNSFYLKDSEKSKINLQNVNIH